MKVLIVAKTRMGGGACIGAITEDGKSVRLMPYNADPHDGANREYNVGDIWEIDSTPAVNLTPPHTEDITVKEKHLLGTANNLIDTIEQFMPPEFGGPNVLYEGLLRSAESGALYVAETSGIPPYSTTFWRPNKPLERDTEGRRVRYRYPAQNGDRILTFVGYQEPLETIPRGTLLRVSLAHPWRPKDKPNDELRCHAQISGWFLTEAGQGKAALSNDVVPTLSQTISPSPLEILGNVFGHAQFRSLQEEIINHILNGHDALIVLPTGGGKSLCYQLPALIFNGVTVVVSPLISLMEDQVMQLQQRNVSATYLNHTVEYSEYVATMKRVKRGEVKLLYMAPETLMRPEILLMLDESNVSCLAIDEAHCISQWGHDFRPEYRELVTVRGRFPKAVCLALTATATPRVREDIGQVLGIPDVDQFIASFDRENLFISVQLKDSVRLQVFEFLNTHPDQSGIIYCRTKKQVESLYQELVARQFPALPYHADLDDATRRQNQESFINGDTRIMVATIAFGMGIDKEDVRFVLHAGLPNEPESYYQEIGRAGRDGNQAECHLLFGYDDTIIINHFIQQGAPTEREGQLQRLKVLVDWATSIECRRKGLLAYFGEQYEGESCGMCDNCRNAETTRVDLTVPAQKFLSCIVKTRQLFGEVHIINVLLGSKGKKVLENGHHRLSTYGDGAEYSKEQWRQLTLQFLQHELLIRDAQHGSLRVTKKGQSVLRGETHFFGVPVDSVNHIPEGPNADETTSEVLDTCSKDLFEKLRMTRTSLADAEQVPSYVVFHDQTLREMATRFPLTTESFSQIRGVGPAKVEKYADVFLPIIRVHCQEHGLINQNQATVNKNKEPRIHRPFPNAATTPIKLYDVPAEIEETLVIPEGEDFDSSQFERLNLTFDEKIHNCAAYMKNIRVQQNALDAHIEILQEDIRELQRKREELESNRKGIAKYIKGFLESLGLEKAGDSIHRVRIARTPLTVEVDMEKLEPKWIKRTENVYADKRGIIEHIKKTDETPRGVRRVENTHLRVS